MRLAAHLLFTYPGVSWIYYGEELGMSGTKPDPNIRQPFKWSNDSAYNTVGKSQGIYNWNAYNRNLEGVYEQLQDEDSLLNLYRDLIALKQGNQVLRQGDFQAYDTNDDRVLGFTRSYSDTTYLILHNLSNSERILNHELSMIETIYQSGVFTYNGSEITLPPYTSVIIEINP